MKKIFFLVALGIILFQFNISAQVVSQKDFYFNKIQTFTKMKHAGIGMTVGGVVLAIVGVKLMVDGSDSHYNSYYGYYEDDLDKVALGADCFVLGNGLIGGGIVLWAIGGNKAKKYREKYKSVSFNLNPDPRQKLSLTFNF